MFSQINFSEENVENRVYTQTRFSTSHRRSLNDFLCERWVHCGRAFNGKKGNEESLHDEEHLEAIRNENSFPFVFILMILAGELNRKLPLSPFVTIFIFMTNVLLTTHIDSNTILLISQLARRNQKEILFRELNMSRVYISFLVDVE